ncbi:MAG TPA: hypothetical protein VFV49_04490 [Thermoanaerobaculia bacterium]|nr:hypothetical protein [Thermoanaerobaculia bacterium]
MAESLVTVAQFHGSTDAEVAKSAMDSAGIESEVENVRLEVHHEDAYRAFGVLDTACPALPVVEEAYEAPKDVTVCAACGSAEIVPTRRGAAFAAVGTIGLGIGVAIGFTDAAFFAVGAAGLFLLVSDRWRCSDCGQSWN